jgi:hypothetical protein
MMIGVSVGAKFVKTIVETAIIAPGNDVTLNDLYDATAKIATTGYGPFRTALVKNMIVEE